jgi:hypothetical protein
MLACPSQHYTTHAPWQQTNISRQKRVGTERAALAIIVRPQNDQDVLDRNHQRKAPNDERQRAHEIRTIRRLRKRRRKHIERRGSNIAIDDTDALVRQ